MHESGSENQERRVKRGQLWRGSDDGAYLIVGRSKTRGLIAWSYAEQKLAAVDPATFSALMQDVCLPRGVDGRPTIASAGAFSWSPQEGYQQARGASAGDMGLTELARMEDAQAAISDAIAQRDAAIASVATLREAVAAFSAALDARFGDTKAADASGQQGG